MTTRKGVNPFKTYQTEKVASNEARIRGALVEAAKKKMKLTYRVLSKLTGIPYSTLKSHGAAGKRYRALIDPAIIRSKDWKLDPNLDLPERSPRTLEEAKAHISVLSYQLAIHKSKVKEYSELMKQREKLLTVLGFKAKKQPAAVELNLATDFCDLIDMLFETCHLDFDDQYNIIARGLPHDVRAPRALATIYRNWKSRSA